MPMESFITGIGGVFFRTAHKTNTLKWFETHFGMKAESWGAVFPWRDHANPDKEGTTSWGVFENESGYFGNPDQQYMINYRVRNMEDLLEKLKAEGVEIVKPMESIEFGKFAWVNDPDGHRIELWEPVDEAMGI